jgi:uncharacterized protein YvpB
MTPQKKGATRWIDRLPGCLASALLVGGAAVAVTAAALFALYALASPARETLRCLFAPHCALWQRSLALPQASSMGPLTARLAFLLPSPTLERPSSTPTVTVTSTASRTPFQPKTNTPTPTITPTRTSTPTPTPTATDTPTPTATATETSTPTPAPTDTPIPPSEPPPPEPPPEAAAVSGGVAGHLQSYNLTCESRSAVDWARFFGAVIGEMEFQKALPTSDNPNTGFVGPYTGERGMIPPNPYGVHAAPVADLLRQYGITASAVTGMQWDDLRREIAADRPVIAWVIGNVWTGTRSVRYTASDGETLRVAAFEHTVIVTAYDAETVTVVDNNLVYLVTVERFLESWAVLGNMAVIGR